MTNQKKISILIIILLILMILWITVLDRKMMATVGKAVYNALPAEEVKNDEKVFKLSKEERVYKYVKEIFTMLNDKEYEKLYALLKDDYKEYKFNNNFETFKQYIDLYMKEKYSPKFKDFYCLDRSFIVLTEFLKEEYDEKDLLSKNEIYLDTINIEELKENDYRFAMGGFISHTSLFKEVVQDNIKVKVDGITYFKDSGEIKFSIKNESNKMISVSRAGYYFITNYYAKKGLPDINIYNINPGEEEVITKVFNYNYKSMVKMETFVVDATSEEKIIKIQIPLKNS